MMMMMMIKFKKNRFKTFERLHCIKSELIRSYSGPHFPACRLNTDQNNSEYEDTFYAVLILNFPLNQ